MEIVYSQHAQKRMAQRKVTVAQVEAVLESPDEIVTGDEGEDIASRQNESHEIKVVYKLLNDGVVFVITVIKSRVNDYED